VVVVEGGTYILTKVVAVVAKRAILESQS